VFAESDLSRTPFVLAITYFYLFDRFWYYLTFGPDRSSFWDLVTFLDFKRRPLEMLKVIIFLPVFWDSDSTVDEIRLLNSGKRDERLSQSLEIPA
jgi:hypothetical protein